MPVDATGGVDARLGKMRRGMDTRGILHPAEVGRAFTLERPAVSAALREVVDSHWAVAWRLPAGVDRRSEVLTHPAVHVVIEPHGALVYGVRRRLDVRVLSDAGFAVGTRFRPGAFGALIDGPVSALTDRAAPAAEVFGAAGVALERGAARATTTAERVVLLEALVVGRLREPTAETELVRVIVEDVAVAPPDTTVAALAARHGVSTRTLQRLFARHVGVGPKWVLRRLRMHAALEGLAGGAADVDWTRFALDLGYFDHAHFIRDFRAVVGRSPARYADEAAAAAHAAARTMAP
jgi:AraC-like DNA-binding protein